MKLSAVLFLMISVVSPIRSSAQAHCPWLNASTAAGLLHGEVQTTVSPLAASGDATCEFVQRDHSETATLRIAVKTMSDPVKQFAVLLAQCAGKKTSLKAVGNEAVQCISVEGTQVERIEVIGRVRARSFVVLIKARTTDQARSENDHNEQVRNLAEQVAGILF